MAKSFKDLSPAQLEKFQARCRHFGIDPESILSSAKTGASDSAVTLTNTLTVNDIRQMKALVGRKDDDYAKGVMIDSFVTYPAAAASLNLPSLASCDGDIASLQGKITPTQHRAVRQAMRAYLFGDSSKLADYEEPINAMYFPQELVATAAADLTITAADSPYVFGSPLNVYGTVTLEDGAMIQVNATLTLQCQVFNPESSDGATTFDIVLPVGQAGQPGKDGTAGQAGKPYENSGAPFSAGQEATPGGIGQVGYNGTDAIDGVPVDCTLDLGEITAKIAIFTQGGTGQPGGNGGAGGAGGVGGSQAKESIEGGGTTPLPGPVGGAGGNGGNAGNAGNGTDGPYVAISYSPPLPSFVFSMPQTVGGTTGDTSGLGNSGGAGGAGGMGPININYTTGDQVTGVLGPSGSAGLPGLPGLPGQPGAPGGVSIQPES